MIEVEIDGKKIQVEPGKMVIEVADDAGIPIPRFCYHKKLSIAANCRMCLVEVEKAPKPLPACATPVNDGMVVRTQSARALDAQRAVMEFLLINHPLDCPICDQGGECELQDVAMGYGKDVSRYTEGKRSVYDQDIGSLVQTDMTRCIQCTRCVRFGDEIIGLPQLGTIGRGESTEISTYVEKSLYSPMSGNIIDLCPVGALTSKPFRYQARSWEMEQTRSYSPHDCVGSHLHIQQRRNEVLRVAPSECEAINEVWLSDRDRFSYLGVNHPERLGVPLIKKDDEWQETDWQFALNVAADGIKKTLDANGAHKLGALISPSATTEEMYLLQKMLRQLGSQNIDHRLHITDVADQKHVAEYPGMGFALHDIDEQKNIFIVGAYIEREQPIIAHRIRKAFLQGANIFAINPIAFPCAYDIQQQLIEKPSRLPWLVAGVAKALLEKHPIDIEAHAQEFLADMHITDEMRAFAEALSFKQGYIFFGEIAQNHPQASILRYFVELIAKLTDSKIAIMTAGANSTGAWLAGAVPHRASAQRVVASAGLNAKQMFDAKLSTYILFNFEPEFDCTYAKVALDALKEADLVIVMTPFVTETMKSYADIILPITPFTETSGTFVNVEGKWQSFQGAVKPFEESRPGWKVLRVLANLLNIEGFAYTSSTEVRDDLKLLVDAMLGGYHKILELPQRMTLPSDDIERIGYWPIYRVDNIVRRSGALQANVVNESPKIWGNRRLAERLSLEAGERVTVKQSHSSVQLAFFIDDHIADDAVYIPAGFEETACLNELFGPVTITRSS
jgi:NADH-quinone oxidoreductase subunit G